MDVLIHTPKITPTGMQQLTLALEYIKHSPTFSMYYQNMNGMTIYVGSNMPTIEFSTTAAVSWNPTQGLQVVSEAGVLGVQSAALGLVHEIAHAVFGYGEAQATAFETVVARELGEPTRANYGATGSDVTLQNVTQHTDNGQWKTYEKGGGTKVGVNYDGSNVAPPMGWGYIPTPPGMPKGWIYNSPATKFSIDSNGDLRDASYLEFPPYNQKSAPNNVDTKILELHLAQEDSTPVSALEIEHTGAHHVAAQLVGVPESVHYS